MSDTTGLDWWNPISAVVSVVSSAGTYAVNTATAVGQTVVNAVVSVKTAAGNFAASVVDTFQAGANTVTWLTTEAGQQLVILGNQAIAASKDAALGFVKQLEQYGKSITDLTTAFANFGSAATTALQALIANPSGFLTNVGAAVGTGISNFFNNLTTTLPNALISWLTQGINFPNLSQFNLTTPAGVGQFLLTFFNLTWTNIQTMLVNVVGAGNIALITQAYSYVSAFVTQGINGVFNLIQEAGGTLNAATLVQQAISAGVNYIVTNLVPKAVAFIAAKFAIPAAGILTTIYDTVTWLYSSINQVTQLANLATTIANGISGVVAGSQSAITALAGKVTTFLNGLIPVGINFLAGQLHITDLPQAVLTTLQKVQAAPTQAINAAITFMVNKAKGLLGFNAPENQLPQGLLIPENTFTVGTELHHLWEVNQGKNAVILRASSPTTVSSSSDLLTRYGNYDTRFVSAATMTALNTALASAEAAENALEAAAISGALPSDSNLCASKQSSQPKT